MADAGDAAIRARIIKHMNADHAGSLSIYLEHFLGLSPRASQGAVITSISLSSMTLQTMDSKTHTVPLEPPMTTWAEARPRCVAMDAAARAGQMRRITITRYIPPTSVSHVSIFLACFFAFSSFALVQQRAIVPGTFFYDNILPWFPGGGETFVALARTITFPVLAIHAAEVWYLDRSRLQKYGVARGSRLWWLWVLSCFMEGFGCFQRIDAYLNRKILKVKDEPEKAIR